MEQLTCDCVHSGCFAKNMTHTIVATTSGPQSGNRRTWNMFLECRKCQRGTVIYVLENQILGSSPATHTEMVFQQYYTIFGSAPRREKLSIVEFLPDNIEKPWVEAEHAFEHAHPGTAAMAYRRVLERSIRTKHPELKGGLAERINNLKGELPEAIIDMANQVRFLGNDGAHEENDPDLKDVADGRDFVRLYLEYTYELPAKVMRAVEAREERKVKKKD